MRLPLPDNFASDTNELVSVFRNFEASIDNAEKDALLRKALISSCRILSAIDLPALSDRVHEIYSAVQEYEKTVIRTTTWLEAMFGPADHFHYFLNTVEDGILKGIRIKKQNRIRILKEMATLRELAHTEGRKLTAYKFIESIRTLQEDICQIKDQIIIEDERRAVRNKVLKTILVLAGVANTVVPVAYPSASPAALAASLVLSHVALLVPDVT